MHTCHEVSVLYSGCGVCVITRGGALFCLHKKSMTSKLQSYIAFPNSPNPTLLSHKTSLPILIIVSSWSPLTRVTRSHLHSPCVTKTILIPISQTHIMHTLQNTQHMHMNSTLPNNPYFFSYLLFPLLLS
jgi:hypothetical protein